MKLELRGIAVDCIFGALAEERLAEQRIWIDLDLELREQASLTDDLADSLDYAQVVARVRELLKRGRYQMLEFAARSVAEALARYPQVTAGWVRVRKLASLPGLESAAAVYAWPRSGDDN